jgi:pimeloyl-ACP methyl ester carboxylesterase
MVRVQLADDSYLHCYVDGSDHDSSARSVVMYHGIGRSGELLSPWVSTVADRRTVYRLEMRGCGLSSIPEEHFVYTTQQIVSDVIAALDRLGLEKVHWMGESSGGIVGQLVLSAHPSRIASLVLCSTPKRIPDHMRLDVRADRDSAPTIIRRDGFGSWVRGTMDSRLDPSTASTELRQWIINVMSRTPDHVAASILDCLLPIDLTAGQQDVQVPCLLIYGERHPTVGLQDDLFAGSSEVRRLRVPAVGAGAHFIAAATCASAAVKFWDELDNSLQRSYDTASEFAGSVDDQTEVPDAPG